MKTKLFKPITLKKFRHWLPLLGIAALAFPCSSTASETKIQSAVSGIQLYTLETAASKDAIPTLEELATIKFTSSATLTPTAFRNRPAALTVIDAEQIRSSGARSLDELLEIYIPSMLSLHHPTVVGRRFVTRGIVSNDNVLILVNGRVMNERFHAGAHSERALSMLGDIESIEVIRGPGAAIHGAGAVAAVISIKTFNGKNFDGADVSLRKGEIEDFANFQFRLGHQFNSDNKIFFYYGLDSYHGGSVDDSPLTFGSTFGNFNAGDELTEGVVPVNQSFRDKLRHKLHIQWDIGDFETWLRYTKGGTNMSAIERGVFSLNGDGYDQLTWMLTHKKKLTDSLELTSKISYDFYNYVQIRDNPISIATTKKRGATKNPEAWLFSFEQQYLAGIGVNWAPHEDHMLYLGFDFSYDTHNDDPLSYPNSPPKTVTRLSPWSTTMKSLITEYQWQMSDRFTLFAGGRFEKHSKIDKMLNSPRAALVFRQNQDRTFKLVYNHSIRRSEEYNLERYEEKDSEEIDYFDFIYHQQINAHLASELSAYYARHDLINFSWTTGTSRPIGQTEFGGFEWELNYTTDKWQILFSLAYAKLINLKLINPNTVNSISAEPQGFGNDFAEVPNWIIKLRSQYKFNDKLSVDGSIVSHLGIDGRKDLFHGLRKREVTDQIDDGIFLLNLGADYKLTKAARIRFDAHNILGWIDDDLNNRFLRGTTEYRGDVPSFSISLHYKFGS